MAVAPLSARQREGTEWSITYNYNANQSQLPRVLLIGDSICNGYQTLVRDKLAGTAYVSFWATSKCCTDPSYLKELGFILGEYDYQVIHFNNGLHSLDTDRTAWEAALRAAFELLKQDGQGARIIWASSTPLKDPALTEKAKTLNAIAARVVAELGCPTDDLFALMDPHDRDKLWSDTFHYKTEGREMQAAQVAESVKPLLAGWKPPAAPAAKPVPAGQVVKNADFEGNGSWQVYPPNGASGSFELVTDGARAGRAAKVTVTKAGLQFYQHGPAFTPGTTCTLKYQARAEQPAKMQVHLRTQKPEYKFYGDHKVDLTDQWQEFSARIEVPADYQAGLHVLFFNFPTPGVYWLDDVRVEE